MSAKEDEPKKKEIIKSLLTPAAVGFQYVSRVLRARERHQVGQDPLRRLVRWAQGLTEYNLVWGRMNPLQLFSARSSLGTVKIGLSGSDPEGPPVRCNSDKNRCRIYAKPHNCCPTPLMFLQRQADFRLEFRV